MNIQRIDPERRMSEAVLHHQTIYYTSIPENPQADAEAQTANALKAIDRLLQRVGSDKHRILDATIFLVDKDDFAAMNRAWDACVSPDNPPVRCTVQAGLMHPDWKVEIKIIAAV